MGIGIAARCLSDRVGVGASLRVLDLTEGFAARNSLRGLFAGHGHCCRSRQRRRLRGVSYRDRKVEARHCHRIGTDIAFAVLGGNNLLHRDDQLDRIRRIRVGEHDRVGGSDRADVVHMHRSKLSTRQRDGLYTVRGGVARDLQHVVRSVLNRYGNCPRLVVKRIVMGIVVSAGILARCLSDRVSIGACRRVLDRVEYSGACARDDNGILNSSTGVLGQRGALLSLDLEGEL